MEADLIDIYSNMKSGMMTELLSGSLDPAFQDVISTVTETINDGIRATMMPMTTISPATHTKSYKSSQENCNAKRVKTLALENAVIGNGIKDFGALENFTPAKKIPKGKSSDIDLDLTSVCWMELFADHDESDPQKKLI